MKTRIIDGEALRAVTPSALAAFARSEGWQRSESFGDHADIYIATGQPEIMVPRSDRLGDYAAAVSRLLAVFAEVADRDELATYRDLVVADRDVVRIRAFGGDDDGSLPVDAGVSIVTNAYDMLMAAACAAQQPQAYYRAGANREAADYMKRVRLGQTEHGSFVVTLLAPVPPRLPSLPLSLGDDMGPLEDEPMERRVTYCLVGALEASRHAAEVALSGQVDAFERAVTAGVSANLCEAIAGLIEPSQGLEIGVTWARTRPLPERRRKVAFSQSDAVILREAARTFRLRQPKVNERLFGTVVRLKRPDGEEEGEVTLKAVVDDRPQSVTARLDAATYDRAVAAHRAHLPVVMTGDMKRVGQRWRIDYPSLIAVALDDGADTEVANDGPAAPA